MSGPRTARERLGVNQFTVSFWESGRYQPRASMLVRVADLYCCTIDELMDRSSEQNSA